MDSSSTQSLSEAKKEPKVLFGIDLNEIPSSPTSGSETLVSPSLVFDSFQLVRNIYGDTRRPFRAQVDLPHDVHGVPCVCGRVEARGGVVVCDGCERWFHLSCAGLRSRQAVVLEDWTCVGCLGNGVRNKKRALGFVSAGPKRTGVRFLDINASPPSDIDGDENEEIQQHSSASMTYPALWYPGTGFDVQREPVSHPVILGPERTVDRALMNRSSEEADLSSSGARKYRSTQMSLRKKELARRAGVNNFTENREALRNGLRGDISSDVELMERYASTFQNNDRVIEAAEEGNGGYESQQHNDGLPVQYEDLFLLCLGKIDSRPSYHNNSQIWPVGYKSTWHDKVTGSLFLCDVLDGGSSGPIFKVKRCPCFTSVIPNAATVLLRQSIRLSDVEDKVESKATFVADMDYSEDSNIQVLLSDPSPPEQDLLSCLGGSRPSGVSELQTCDIVTSQGNHINKRSDEILSSNLELKDVIGEFFAEGRSSSLVWRKVSEMLIDACREAYKQFGSLKFCCTHKLDSDAADVKNKNSVSSLGKFCTSSGPRHIPSVIRSYNELEMSCKELEGWLNQDRFGLDIEFVQEIIEQLPGCLTCSEYEFLTKRSDYSTSETIGNGRLHAKRKSGEKGKEGQMEALGGLFNRYKRRKKQDTLQNSQIKGRCPPGKPLSLNLPAELIGDILQVWELFCRFNDILGLKEPLLFKEIEGELMNPWFYGTKSPTNFEKNIQEDRDLALQRGQGATDNNLSASGEPDLTVLEESIPKFIEVETFAAKEAAQAKLASRTYYRCTGVALTKAHSSLLKVLVGELRGKVAALLDPNFDGGESKSRRGRKKEADNSIPIKKLEIGMLPVNELTWPELARRYILACLCMDGCLDSSEGTCREGIKVFRCLQGDGGMLCGSLTGVGGMEADALLLAEATKQIFGSLNRENEVWSMEYEDSDAVGASETITTDGDILPEWAQVLGPVKKLPTNVGTRIRKCVYDALDKGPPEWAKKILLHSISKEVYKGNASGPTKKAVIALLSRVRTEASEQKPNKAKKGNSVKTISDVIMKQCRYVLRRAIIADEAKVFCNLLGTTSLNANHNEDEGNLGSPAMVSRPLDFRTIDLRLSVGAYGGSYEAFLEDVREVWHNIHIAYGDRPDLINAADKLSENFESLYQEEVFALIQKVKEHTDPQKLSSAVKKALDEFVSGKDIPKAPWDDGVCKLCGIDKDDESVLLCDTCDSEYHTYCLNPPLARIPEGNWYCPSCVTSGQGKTQDASKRRHVISHKRRKRFQGERTRVFSEALTQLATTMEEKDYWDCSLEERLFLLKFLTDEVLNSSVIREHLDQCAETSVDLQQKLRSLSVELRNLKFKEEHLAKESIFNGVGEAGREGISTTIVNHGRRTGQRQIMNNKYNHYTSPSDNLVHFGDVPDGNEFNCLNIMKSNISEERCNGNRSQHVKLLDTEEQERDALSTTDDMETNDFVQPTLEVPNGQEAYNLEMDSCKNEISRMQETITGLESQLLTLSNRRDFLGRDAAGRLYWALSRPGKCPWLVVDGSIPELVKGSGPKEVDGPDGSASTYLRPASSQSVYSSGYGYGSRDISLGFSSWVSYNSDVEIQELVGWLNEPEERELRESIWQIQRLRYQISQLSGNHDTDDCHVATSRLFNAEKGESPGSLVTKAYTLLEKKYGLCLGSEGTDVISKKRGKKSKVVQEEKMYRCECLEPVWPSRHHCISCHQTFCTISELEGHNEGKCNSLIPSHDESKETEDLSKGKGKVRSEASKEESTDEMNMANGSKGGKADMSSRVIKFQKKEMACPYNFEEISKKFIIKSSNKELVQEIGLIGSNGIPTLIPLSSPYIHDSTLILDPAQINESEIGISLTSEEAESLQQKRMEVNVGLDNPKDSSGTYSNGAADKEKQGKVQISQCSGNEDPVPMNKKTLELEASRICVVPEPSLRPLVGNVSEILKRLKINLLDMDAALPEEALRPSRSHPSKRSAWRAFVKSAESIFEMIQATIVFEDMIKTDHLRNEWWYWSSLSAAAKTSTISSLALRIYTLDTTILYQKTPPVSGTSHSTENLRQGKKRKDFT